MYIEHVYSQWLTGIAKNLIGIIEQPQHMKHYYFVQNFLWASHFL